MPIAGAIIGGVAAIGGGLIASSGAKSAAKTQAAAADRSAELQREMFERQVSLQEPFRQAGLTAQQQIMQLLGIGGDTIGVNSAALQTGNVGPFGISLQEEVSAAASASLGQKDVHRHLTSICNQL